VGADQAFRGEERHLRVVGDCPDAAVRGRKLLDAVASELAPDLVDRHELDGRPQCIADGAAEEAAPNAIG
jgi:hypothetical protein